MTAVVMLGVFCICVAIGAPIGTCMCLSSVSALLTSGMGLSMVAYNYYAAISKFLLLAIPFFILAGNIMEKAGISLDFYAYRQRDLDEVLPWDFIDVGVRKDFFKKEWQRATVEQVVTPNCRMQCSGCGAAGFKGGVCFEGKN